MNRTAILYARVSSDEQARHGYSLSQQIVALREWATSEDSDQITVALERGKHG